MITLRKYQEECVKKMLWARNIEGGSLVSLPTGSGKSLVISELAKRLNEPILILCPSKELLEQDQAKLEHWTQVSVYSAGSGSKEVGNITIATVQSAYKNPGLFTNFNVVIIDEAHNISPKNLEGMYHKLFKGMRAEKVYGLTATPYRMDFFYKRWGPQPWQVKSVHCLKVLTRYQQRFWKQMLYVSQTQDLIDEGFLTPLTYHQVNLITQDKLSFNKSKSEFDMEDFEEQFNPFLDETSSMIAGMEGSVLVFCANIQQSENLQNLVDKSVIITGTTPKKKREQIVEGFRNGGIRVVINVGVLTTGFDKPDLENIVLCRPTRSVVLHSQLLGRGMRIHTGKKTCHVWDLVGNVQMLGKAESIRIEKLIDKWDITTDTFPYGMHLEPLFEFKLRPRSKDNGFIQQ